MKLYIIIGILAAMLVLAGCSSETSETSDTSGDSLPAELPPLPGAPAGGDTPAGGAGGGDGAQADDAPADAGAEAAPPPQTVTVDMIAKQWDFEPSTVTVNEGDTVVLNIESIDVAHGIGLPDFGVNQRLDPGKTERIEFVADKKGSFSFFCSVSCGKGHRSMKGTLVVN